MIWHRLAITSGGSSKCDIAYRPAYQVADTNYRWPIAGPGPALPSSCIARPTGSDHARPQRILTGLLACWDTGYDSNLGSTIKSNPISRLRRRRWDEVNRRRINKNNHNKGRVFMQVILDSHDSHPTLRVSTDHERAHPYRDSKREKNSTSPNLPTPNPHQSFSHQN